MTIACATHDVEGALRLQHRALHRRFGARSARRGVAVTSGGGGPPPTLIGVSGAVAGTNHYQSASSEGPPGGNAYTFWCLFWDRADAAVTQVICARSASSGATTGWRFVIAAAGTVSFRVGTGSTGISSPTYTLGAADLSAWTVFHGVIDVAGNALRLYRNGVQVGTGTALSAYAAGATTTAAASRVNGGEPLMRGEIGGMGAVDAVMSGAEIAAHYAAIVAAGKSVLPGVGTSTWNYDANDAAATWPYTGTGPNGTLTRTGTMTLTPRPLIWST